MSRLFTRNISSMLLAIVLGLGFVSLGQIVQAETHSVQFKAKDSKGKPKHVVLLAGDEEYRSEESLPMLGKILSQHHGFDCTVLFSMSEDGSYIDPTNQAGIGGLEALDDADLLIISTRFRRPTAEQAEHLNAYLNQAKPVIGLRTATHAFTGKGSFGQEISYDDFGLKVLGERWVNHHGGHKSQGARGVVEDGFKDHPILNSVGPVFAPSDVYGVVNLKDSDQILLRAAVTQSLDPESANITGPKNNPMQPLAWVHTYTAANGKQGKSFCTTAGASVDFVDEDLRRLVVNAAFYLTSGSVPEKANVDYVDPFYPSFFGFISDKNYWAKMDMQPSDYALGKSPALSDPPGSPAWSHRPMPPESSSLQPKEPVDFVQGQRIAMVGNSLAERMNLFGHFESLLHTRLPQKQLIFRNFGWPADEVANQQRPGNYTNLDNPLDVFNPDAFLCFYGFNESFNGPEGVSSFIANYRSYLNGLKGQYGKDGRKLAFVLVSPVAFEASGNPLQPLGNTENANLKLYTAAIKQLANEDDYDFVDLFAPTSVAFGQAVGTQFTVNGVHLNENGDKLVSQLLDVGLFQSKHPKGVESEEFQRIRYWVNDKSWYHLQDYRMLNGWYVYGGRRTWDTETFPSEYLKIRKIVDVRDQYLWDLAAGNQVPIGPDDSTTGEVFNPETMFGSRDDNFRRGREPEVLKYSTPEESIQMMSVPEGFKVELFASEREFPELANPNQLAFDNKGRLWVSCMVNYPQWQPGAPKPTDRLLILEDTDNDGKADKCTPFYDKLICPTGFEFWNGGVLVVDEPRILFLKDTDGDDKADVVEHLIDGIATDDTHHTVGAWEFSHGGQLHMLEGVSMSTTIETPWGPFRNKGTAGTYILDPHTLKLRHFITPGYGNPWCLVFDNWGNGIVGDGTNAQQHWTSPLSGLEVSSRKTLQPVFNNEGMRPAVGNEFLLSRQFPDDIQGQFIYACVINMHGMPRFTVKDEVEGAGFEGKRIEDLLSSTDGIFRPVDPKIGPDGALWFGDWCNALIGHMQYSQRDPNRDHEHGRVYRLVYEKKPLLEPITQFGKSIPELLEQLMVYELRTRYRVRSELRTRPKAEVFAAIQQWIAGSNDPQQLCEAMWIQESFRDVDPALLEKLMVSEDFHARAAAVHTLTNEYQRQPKAFDYLTSAITDAHPRVRLEAIRGLSFFPTTASTQTMLKMADQPRDYWLDYTMEHSLQAHQAAWEKTERDENFLAGSSDEAKSYFKRFRQMSGPGGAAVEPLAIADNVDQPLWRRQQAVDRLAQLDGGNVQRGAAVFKNVCSACHMVGDIGKKFGPDLSNIGARFTKNEIVKSIVLPNDTIAKGYETVLILTLEGATHTGFILAENDEVMTLGIADAKIVEILKEDIDQRKDMKASSMPEGLAKTIAAIEFLDLVAYMEAQSGIKKVVQQGWISAAYSGDNSSIPLRTHEGLSEISRAAGLRVGGDYPANWSAESHLFLSPIAPKLFDFTFHSPHDADKPSVLVQLSKESEVRHIFLKNRLEGQFDSRADGLTIWTSLDGENWTQAWESPGPKSEWSIDLPAGTKAKYLKIGLNKAGTFHLYQAVVYGN